MLRNPTQQGRMDGLYELGQPLKSEGKKAVISFLKLKQAIINKGKKKPKTQKMLQDYNHKELNAVNNYTSSPVELPDENPALANTLI